MRQFFKRLLLPLFVATVTQTSIVRAEGIRLLGPGGEVQSSPRFSSDVVRNTAAPSALSASNEPSTFFGPTTKQDTLWSIASRLKPSANVSVQQTLLAIYRLNPQAFENQNIHSLIPGSTLRVPSLTQVRKATTQEAVNVMADHQARLNPSQARPNIQPVPKPVVRQTPPPVAVAEVKPQPEPTVKPPVVTENKGQEATQPTAVEPIKTGLNEVAKPTATSDSELLALEENNHKLRLMVAQMQSEVSNLKQELGDENRIRSEVEKLLQEERIKRDEAQKLAPSTLDQLFSSGWMVGLLALIPGLLIGLLVLKLLSRRADASQADQPEQTVAPTKAEAPLAVSDPEIEGLEDELIIDEDLFGGSDDDEQQSGDGEEESTEEADIFADLDESDLDFNLEDEDGQDPFAGIDDDGDLDTDFGNNSDISVNKDDKALGLDEMTRALDDIQSDTEEDNEVFDLSDDDMSQAEIESLLAGDGETEDLPSDVIDQSMLDDLLGDLDGLDDDDDQSSDELDFESLLDENLDEMMSDPVEQALSQTGAKMTSDDDLESLFNQIESQADLDSLETTVDESEQETLLDEFVDNDDEFELQTGSTELLDELLTDDFKLDDIDLESDFDAKTDQLLNELLDEAVQENDVTLGDEEPFDHNSAALLDEWVEKSDAAPASETANELSEEPVLDDGTEFFEELLEIEQQADEPTAEFNSDDFKDDLLSSVPDNDPLLDEFGLDDEDSLSFADDAFDFNPEIEGASREENQPDVPEAESTPSPIANEFGVPQDDDWLLDEDEDNRETQHTEDDPVSSAEFMAELDDAEVPEPVVQDAAEPEFAIDETDLPEYSEEDALADALQAPLAAADSAEPVVQDDAEPEFAIDETDLPEYSEEDALADALQEPLAAADSAEPVVQDDADPEFAIDETDLPEYSEEDALADALQAPLAAADSAEPVVQDDAEPELAIDETDLPEYSEEDALADALSEPHLSGDLPSDNDQDIDFESMAHQEFDESSLSSLLEENETEDGFRFTQPIDAQTIDSAGMDIDAMLKMGGEDWNGFSLTPDQQATIPDDVPEDERAVWREEIQNQQPEVETENWATQEDIADFDPKDNQFMTIDELMAQVEREDPMFNPDDEELKLDVGLNEFPDVIGEISDVDVDSNSEAAGKLDLAKIYMEMNDEKGAVKLLEEAIVDGSDEIRQQAKRLIDVINGRI